MRGLKSISRDSNDLILMSHLTRGAWIEIFMHSLLSVMFPGRTSHEVRGLKCFFSPWNDFLDLSHLTRGAWIEIWQPETKYEVGQSHLTRGAWIEICKIENLNVNMIVAPHTRCVD